MNAIETISYKKCAIKIYQDEDAQNPREDDNAGTMLCRHDRYNLGDLKDGKTRRDVQPTVEEIIEITKRDDVLWLPLYLYDHSGITIKAGSPNANWTERGGRFACDGAGWDTSTVGIIYITKEKAVQEWGKKLCTKEVAKKAITCLEGEVETYASYLEGDVYGYVTEGPDGEDIGSCWGFFPDDSGKSSERLAYMIHEAKTEVDYWRAAKAKALKEQRLADRLEREQHLALIG